MAHYNSCKLKKERSESPQISLLRHVKILCAKFHRLRLNHRRSKNLSHINKYKDGSCISDKNVQN